MSHIRAMHPIGVYPSPSVLRPLGRIPSQIPLGGQRTRQWRRQYPIIPKPRPKSSNENDGTSRSNPPKLVPNHVLCLETLPRTTCITEKIHIYKLFHKKRKIRSSEIPQNTQHIKKIIRRRF